MLPRLVRNIALAKLTIDRKAGEPRSSDVEWVEDLAKASEVLSKAAASVRALIKEWGEVMVNADDDTRPEEQDLFLNFKVQEMGPTEIIDEADELQVLADIKIDWLRAQAASSGMPPKAQASSLVVLPSAATVSLGMPSSTPAAPFGIPPTAPSLSPPSGFPPPIVATPMANVRLPPLTLPEFDGTESAWPAFWASFEHSVHLNAGLTGAQKFTYLAGQLKGSAMAMVEGYTLTDANYVSVIAVLVKRFGNDARRAATLQSELLELPSPSNSAASLRAFHNSVERICRQLEGLVGLQVPININPFLEIAIRKKIPHEVRGVLLDKEMASDHKWSPGEWREALGRMVQWKEEVGAPEAPTAKPASNSHSFVPLHQRPPPIDPPKRAFPIVQGLQNGLTAAQCFLCGIGGHRPSTCPTWRGAQARKARMLFLNRCLMCSGSHSNGECRSKSVCPLCGDRHHYLICTGRKPWVPIGGTSQPLSGTGGNSQPLANRQSSSSAQRNVASSHPAVEFGGNQMTMAVHDRSIAPSSRPSAYLMVAEVYVFNHIDPDNPILTPVFFDSGSQPSFITSDLAAQIRPHRLAKEKMTLAGFTGKDKCTPVNFSSSRFSVLLQRQDGGWEPLTLNESPKIIPAVEFVQAAVGQPSGDLLSKAYGVPQILLGVRDFWPHIISKEEVRAGFYRIHTIFGTVYGGEMGPPISTSPVAYPSICCPVVDAQPMVERLWNLEAIGINPQELAKDTVAIDSFNSTINFVDGRYHVSWPWRPGHPPLPDNFNLAYSRLHSLVNRLKCDPKLFTDYQQIFDDQLTSGIVELAIKGEVGEHFIPHHPVVTIKKTRIVYDGSAHIRNSPSLNDCLLAGPNLVPDLAAILLRFRASSLPVFADVEKAFLMVGLNPGDKRVAKFIWIKDKTLSLSPSNLLFYQFARVPFGIASSPFILAATLQHHLKNEATPIAAQMAQNFYVDDLLLDCRSAGEALQKVAAANEIVAKAGMKLRGFTAADPAALAGLPEEQLLLKEEPKVLGLNWKLKSDSLFFLPPGWDSSACTRRLVLSIIASFFDPLGLCSPILFKGRVFFQCLWGRKKSWDDSLDSTDHQRWADLVADWGKESIIIPRLTPCDGALNLQIHVFTDAGPDGYCAAIYLRSEFPTHTSVSLAFSKARLCPTRLNKGEDLTIPKLELMGITVGIRLMKFVQEGLRRQVDACHLWSDSQIALSWVASSDTLPVFVGSRVREIRADRSVAFHYVNTKDNPADLGVRGCSPSALSSAGIWWRGPAWLTEPPCDWPDHFGPVVLPVEEEPELVMAINEEAAHKWMVDPRDFSTYRKLLWKVKFHLFVISHALKGSQSLSERLPWLSQMHSFGFFSPEMQSMAQNYIIIHTQVDLEEGLDYLYQDANGITRLSTRVTQANKASDFINPIVLPRQHWVTRLLVQEAHESLAHTGVEATLCKFLSKWWCKRARRLVRSVVASCLVCRRDRAAKFKLPLMPPLPSARVTASRPFSFVGLDYLGPTLYKHPDGPKNVWVLLLTCFSTRAVHLEVVTSLEAIEFLEGFRRFVARRGIPKEVLSDNASQFVLAKQVLVQYSNIKWRHTPPLAPWAGGIYERLVSHVKVAFRRAVGRKMLTLSQFSTFVVEVEAMINHRPITYVSDDPDATLALRPVDFLLPHSQMVMSEPTQGENVDDPVFRPSPAEKLAGLWHATTVALRNYWRIWSKDYLLILRQRNEREHQHPRIQAREFPQVGQTVLVEMEESPKNHWPMGRIVALGPGLRSAQLMMGNGRVWGRPVNKLVPLEVQPEEELEAEEMEEEDRETSPSPSLDHAIDLAVRPPILRWAPTRPTADDDASHEQVALEEAAADSVGPVPTSSGAGTPTVLPDGTHWTRSKAKKGQRSAGSVQMATPITMAVISHMPFCLVLSLICSGLGGTGAASPSIQPLDCQENGVKVNMAPGASKVETCCGEICDKRPYTGPFTFPMPNELLAIGYQCTTTYTMRDGKYEYKVDCAHTDGCELITCFLCWERVMNPHCAPLLSAIAFGFFFGFTAILLFLLFALLYFCYKRRAHFPAIRRPRWPWGQPPPLPVGPTVHWHGGVEEQQEIEVAVLDPPPVLPTLLGSCQQQAVEIRIGSPDGGLRRRSRQRSAPIRQPVEMETIEEEEDLLFARPSTSRARSAPVLAPRQTRARTKLGLAFGLTLFMLALPLALASLEIHSLTAKTEHCSLGPNGTTCSFEAITSLNLLPAKQPLILQLRGPHDLHMGNFSFVLEELDLVCIQSSSGWLRSALIRNHFVRRCNMAGSCVPGSCSAIGPKTSVPELVPAEGYPGNNFCREVDGFWTRGCILPDGCLFYRIYALPAARHIYELVRCPTWQYRIKVAFTFNHAIQGSGVLRMEMTPGVTYHVKGTNVSFTPSPMGLPPLPILGEPFLINHTHGALASSLPTVLHCPSRTAAFDFKCRLDNQACSECQVYPQAGVVQCDCNDFVLEKLFTNPYLSFPLKLSHLSIYKRKEGIVATVPYTPVNVIMESKGTTLVVEQTLAVCRIEPIKLVGCYNCLTGGRLSYHCVSSFGEVMASIRCADRTTFLAHCNPKGKPSSVVLGWSHPQVDTNCSVDCGYGLTSFSLNGTLIFLNTQWSHPSFEQKEGKAPLSFAHFQFVLWKSVGSIPQAIAASVATILVLLVFWMCYCAPMCRRSR